MSDAGSDPSPGVARVAITLTYTFEEFREGIAPLRKHDRQLHFWVRMLGMASWIITTCAILWILWTARAIRNFSPLMKTLHPARWQIDFWMAFIPSAIAAATVLLFFLLNRGLMWTLIKVGVPLRWAGFAVGAISGLILLLLTQRVLRIFDDWQPQPWPSMPLVAIIAAFAPWGLLYLFLKLRVAWLTRRRLLQQWKLSPTFQRQRSIQIDAGGMTIDDTVSRMFYRWPYYKSASETEKLIVLSDEVRRRHILPKRTFANKSQIQMSRNLIAAGVADCKFQIEQRGFSIAPRPVLAIQPPANH